MADAMVILAVSLIEAVMASQVGSRLTYSVAETVTTSFPMVTTSEGANRLRAVTAAMIIVSTTGALAV
ncbi:hypothetical protein AU504_14550 [Lonsdalea populi]|nr:hypothetical protein AU508_05895 [Lonsdalea populi]RAT67214.1 hypothetical protein AU504_14550 [Lonsdalea populi]RAT68004.1 hypothetical protein AU505_15440 [Lonsdalea populi]RAT72649.1 hypothetical protein AU506_14870 [Lonsdalea populi]RAT76375.1 hypothetical protein AU507_14090 [Lonsdalea populi]